jgi:hypothetical protein
MLAISAGETACRFFLLPILTQLLLARIIHERADFSVAGVA